MTSGSRKRKSRSRAAARFARGGLAALCSAVLVLGSTHCAAHPAPSSVGAVAGSAICQECHEQEAKFWSYGAHRKVECEGCHGAGAQHARAEGPSRPSMSLGDAKLCLSCHGQGAPGMDSVVSVVGSFEDHLQTVERDHRVKLNREKVGRDCVYCHDPHLLE